MRCTAPILAQIFSAVSYFLIAQFEQNVQHCARDLFHSLGGRPTTKMQQDAVFCRRILRLSLMFLQGRTDVLAELVTHLMAEHDVHRPLQTFTTLLRHQKMEALCALCCEMAAESHVAQVATLLAEAAR